MKRSTGGRPHNNQPRAEFIGSGITKGEEMVKMKQWTIRKLLNDVLGCNKALDIDAPIQFSIVENLNMNDETEETLKPIGVFSTEQGENSNEICFGFKRVK